MLKKLYYEIRKNFKKKRTFWAFLSIAILVTLMLIGYKTSDPLDAFRGTSLINPEKYINSILFSTIALFPLSYTLMPVLATLFGAEIISGELQTGTLRTAMSRPISRWYYILIKYIYCFIITFIFILFAAIFCLLIGTIFLGIGDLAIGMRTVPFLRIPVIKVIPLNEALGRYFTAYLLIFVAIFTMTSLAFCLSTLLKNTAAAMIVTISIYFMLLILSEIPWLESWRPYIFTTKMHYWITLFKDPVPAEGITKIYHGLRFFVLHNIALFAIATITFIKRDIKC